MNNKNSYYEWNKEKLKRYAKNRHYSKNGKAKSKEYYENNKERLQPQARNSYINLSEEENRNKNMSKRKSERIRKRVLQRKENINIKKYFFVAESIKYE